MTKKDKETAVDTSNAASNGQFIVMLTEAEKKAREIVDAAKKRKAAILKKARDESTSEIEEFRRERESILKKLNTEFTDNKDMSAIQVQRDLESKRSELKSKYQEHFENTLQIIMGNIIQVDPKCHGNLKI